MLSSLSSQMNNNNLVQGGLVLLLVQSASSWIRQLVSAVVFLLLRTFLVSVSFDNTEDGIYQWCMQYIGELGRKGYLTASELSIFVDGVKTKKQLYRQQYGDGVVSSAKQQQNLMFLPGPGYHLLRLGWRLVLIHRKIADPGLASGTQQLREVLTLTTLNIPWLVDGKRFFGSFVRTARENAFEKDTERTVIYVQDRYGIGRGWTKSNSKPARAWESVILDGDISERVFNDAQNFLASREFYEKVGTPYRRSYLLASPPGCGKTSFVQALCCRLKLDICVVSLADPQISDSYLSSMLRSVPASAAILLEDLDAAFPKRSSKDDGKEEAATTNNNTMGSGNQQNLTMSGLLNAIDGLNAPEGRIFLFTTNHIDHLDPALLRPGRCDMVVRLTLASPSQVQRMFLRFFPDEHQLSKLFTRSLPPLTVSMAALQNHLLMNRTDAMLAIKRIPEFLDEVKQLKKESGQVAATAEDKESISLTVSR